MTFHSPTLTRYLKALEQQVTRAPRHAALLQSAFEERGATQALVLCTQPQAGPRLRTMALTALEIKAQVLPGDGLSTTLGSLSELVLRAARMVVLAELGSLYDVLNDASARLSELMPAPFERLDDWITYVGLEVNEITQGCICYRGPEATERLAYRVALRNAHRAMRHLGSNSRAAPFLHGTVNQTNWPALQDVCSRIWLMLTLQIEIDADIPISVASSTHWNTKEHT